MQIPTVTMVNDKGKEVEVNDNQADKASWTALGYRLKAAEQPGEGQASAPAVDRAGEAQKRPEKGQHDAAQNRDQDGHGKHGDEDQKQQPEEEHDGKGEAGGSDAQADASSPNANRSGGRRKR